MMVVNERIKNEKQNKTKEEIIKRHKKNFFGRKMLYLKIERKVNL
jgi:hypothetical protein